MSSDGANLALSLEESLARFSVRSPIHWRSISALASAGFDWLCNAWVLLGCKLVIGVVSAYDIFLTIKYYESLPWLELNPVGRWLMMLDEGPACELHHVAAFIAAKFAGNFIAICVIELLAAWRLRVSTAVALAVAACQMILFCYLQYAHLLK